MDKSKMKQKNFTTTGLVLQGQKQQNEAGLQLGKHGYVQQARELLVDKVATPEDITRCRQWFQDLSKRPLRALTETEKTEAKKLIDWVSIPSPRPWLSSRIVTLLSHYFITQSDERVAKAAAEDWIEILREMPPWAILEACRAYLAGDDCRRKPVAGDILKLAKKQMGIVFLAKNSLIERDGAKDQDDFTPISKEDRALLSSKIEDFKKKMVENNQAFNASREPSAECIARSARKWREFEDGEFEDGGIVDAAPSKELLQTPILKNR